jgi:HAD superfamily hydrolase (TIGR01450 family)
VTKTRLRRLRGFIVDLDGTTYLGDRLIPGAREFFAALARTGRRHVFATNNSSLAGEDYEEKLRRLGLAVAPRQVLTSGEATAMVLAGRGHRRLFVVGTPALEAEMTGAGFVLDAVSPDCVVLGYDRTLTYEKLERAARLIARGVPFVATHPDRVCPTRDGYVPDCGAMIALLQTATGVAPLVVGKPEPLLAEMALQKLGLPASDVAVIGDRLYTDMEMGRRAGTTTILVLSGETTGAMVEQAALRPDIVVADLRALADALEPRPRRHLAPVRLLRHREAWS